MIGRSRVAATADTALRRLASNRRGLALIEFAIVLPVLVTLLFGAYQLLDASACKRRVTITTRAIADLVSQNERVTTTDVDTILSAATQIMSPYPVSKAQVRVSEVAISSGGAAKVEWSRGASPHAKYASLQNRPSGMSTPGAYYIYSEVIYSYDTIMPSIIAPMTFKQTLIMLPRKSASVDLS